MRQFERWLHQHVFKVGWLVTKNFQTTTILYYTFFLPGVVLHELSYWLMAGLLDVRADRAITWPEKQEIGALKLNFVRLSRKAGRIKVAIITATPLVTGIIAVSLIANNVLRLPEVLGQMNTGAITDLGAAIHEFVSTPDVWLWIYIGFTISNTMMPSNPKDLGGWWVIAGAFAGIMVAFFIFGIGDAVIANGLAGPITAAVNLLSGTFAVMIFLDIIATLALSIVENTIELITGDSATFKDGKLIAMRRAEVQAMREQELRKARDHTRRQAAAPGGPPSVYRLPLPIPGAPGKESVTQLPSTVVTPQATSAPGAGAPALGDRRGPNVVSGTVTDRPAVASAPLPPTGAFGPRPGGTALPAGTSERQPSDAERRDSADQPESAFGQPRSAIVPSRSPFAPPRSGSSLVVHKPDADVEPADESQEEESAYEADELIDEEEET